MPTHGFLRVAAAVPALKLADCRTNAKRHLELLQQAEDRGVRLVVFPECSLTGYTCGDLFHQSTLLRAAEVSLAWLASVRTPCLIAAASTSASRSAKTSGHRSRPRPGSPSPARMCW